MADISSHQNNENVQKLLVSVFTNSQTGWTGPATVAGAARFSAMVGTNGAMAE